MLRRSWFIFSFLLALLGMWEGGCTEEVEFCCCRSKCCPDTCLLKLWEILHFGCGSVSLVVSQILIKNSYCSFSHFWWTHEFFRGLAAAVAVGQLKLSLSPTASGRRRRALNCLLPNCLVFWELRISSVIRRGLFGNGSKRPKNGWGVTATTTNNNTSSLSSPGSKSLWAPSPCLLEVCFVFLNRIAKLKQNPTHDLNPLQSLQEPYQTESNPKKLQAKPSPQSSSWVRSNCFSPVPSTSFSGALVDSIDHNPPDHRTGGLHNPRGNACASLAAADRE